MSDKEIPETNNRRFFDTSLTLNDGVKLISRIWTPSTGEGPWPALLMRQPYGREIASTLTYAHPSWWANNGYLVVIQDVRGQGDSGGKFNGFNQEPSDTSQTHEWIRKLPQCNGKLGTYGFSYQGLTQLLCESGTRPPDCLSLAMTGLDEKEHWNCDGGAYWWHIGIGWGLQLAGLKAKREGNLDAWKQIKQSLDNGTYIRSGAALLKQHDPEGMAFNWLKQSQTNQKEWKIHQASKDWLSQPMLLLGGWWDPHLRGMIDIYKKSIASGGKPEFHIGPATHLDWWESTTSIQLDFFNKNLKPNSNTIAKSTQSISLWNLTTNIFNYPEEIETHKSNEIKFWGLISKGIACLDSKDGCLKPNTKGSGLIEIVHDPWRPAPSIGGHLSPSAGPADRSFVDKRSDVATFTSEPLEKDYQIEGFPELRIISTSDQDGYDICLALSVINEKRPQVEQLSTGFLRVNNKKDSLLNEQIVIMQPLLANIKAGSLLRLSIAGAAWPAIGVNPGNNKEKCGPTTANHRVITLTLKLFEAQLSFKSIFK